MTNFRRTSFSNDPENREVEEERTSLLNLATSLPQNEETWFGLTNRDFGYSHHSSHARRIEDEGASNIRNNDNEIYNRQEQLCNERFCPPMSEVYRLRSILRKSKGGSVLVTGYRGTGKSSMVNFAIRELLDETPKDPNENSYYVPIRINLSTSREPIALVMMMIKELREYASANRFDNKETAVIEEAYDRFVKDRTISSSEENGSNSSIGASLPFGLLGMKLALSENRSESSSQSYQFHAYTLHEAQQDLIHCIKRLSARNYKLIFIFDELDKLVPESRHETLSASQKKLEEIKTIVSSLKFLLSEANAFHIFIAGKIVDDSWQEDQNKGEGIFESIFVQNIYVPSTLSSDLSPPQLHLDTENEDTSITLCPQCHKEIHSSKRNRGTGENQIFHLVLKAIGITGNHWSYNTGLLVLPHFSEHELMRLLLRGKKLNRFNKDEMKHIYEYLDNFNHYCKTQKEKLYCKDCIDGFQKQVDHYDVETLQPVSTASRARRLRYLLQYLTYRGRGIPRKILREFYTLVRHRTSLKRELGVDVQTDSDQSRVWWSERGNPQFILHLSKSIRNKIKFFSDIVSLLEKHHGYLGKVDDKGKVAVFYVIDYLFKFYRVGFSMNDIENASFMTHRDELFPSRQLTEYILSILEHFYIIRTDPRLREYTIRPRVRSNLERLYLAFGHEQMELRFTKLDLLHEINHLASTIQEMEKSKDTRHIDFTEIQVRLAHVFELLENHQEAKYEYTKALRWVRAYLQEFEERVNESNITLFSCVVNITKAIEIMRCLGLMYELDCDLDSANQFYQSAIRHWVWAMSKLNPCQPILSLQKLTGQSHVEDTRTSGLTEPSEDSEDSATEAATQPDNEPIFPLSEVDESSDEKKIISHLVSDLLPDPEDRIIDIHKVATALSTAIYRTLPIPFEPIGIRDILNKTAIVMEKKWHRVSANKYMFSALEYSCAKHDEVSMVMQLIFMAEVTLRRRDFISSLTLYYLALKKSVTVQKSGYTEKPDHSFALWGRLFESIGDILYANAIDERSIPSDYCVREKIRKLVHRKIIDDCSFFVQSTVNQGTDDNRLQQCFINEIKNDIDSGDFSVQSAYKLSSLCYKRTALRINQIDVELKLLKCIPNNDWCEEIRNRVSSLAKSIISDLCENTDQVISEWEYLDRKRAATFFQICGTHAIASKSSDLFLNIVSEAAVHSGVDESTGEDVGKQDLFRKQQRIFIDLLPSYTSPIETVEPRISKARYEQVAEFFLLASVINTAEIVEDKEVAMAYAELANLYESCIRGVSDVTSFKTENEPKFDQQKRKQIMAAYWYRKKAITILTEEKEKIRCYSPFILNIVRNQEELIQILSSDDKLWHAFFDGMSDKQSNDKTVDEIDVCEQQRNTFNRLFPSRAQIKVELRQMRDLNSQVCAIIDDSIRQRYRMPDHVIPEQKNIMDPVMHFEICECTRFLKMEYRWHRID